MALHGIDFLEQGAAVAVDTNGFDGKAICCAYVPFPDVPVSITDLRTELSKALPNYMLPWRWMCFDQLSQTANRKVDRPKLRERF